MAAAAPPPSVRLWLRSDIAHIASEARVLKARACCLQRDHSSLQDLSARVGSDPAVPELLPAPPGRSILH